MNKYIVEKKLGSGTFGCVFLVRSQKDGRLYALKQIRVGNSDISKDGVIHPSRELALNQYLMDNSDSVSRNYFVNLIDQFYTQRIDSNGKTIWNNIVLEYMTGTLSYEIAHNPKLNKPCIIRSLITELAYLHSLHIIHRDLKPSNVLMMNDAAVKICDFGCSKRIEGSLESHRSTPLVTSRFYRAPELLMGATRYNTAIDIWSLGCVITEIITGAPPFASLESDAEQLISIINVLGTPTEEDLAQMQVPKSNRDYLCKLPVIRPIPLDTLLPKEAQDYMHLLKLTLQYDPSKRPSAQDLLKYVNL